MLQGYTAAQLATEPVAKLLAEEPANGGIDIEYQLLEAAKAGDLELVRKIVGLHPHIVNCRDLDGRHSTPLHFAAGQFKGIKFYIFYFSYVWSGCQLDFCSGVSRFLFLNYSLFLLKWRFLFGSIALFTWGFDFPLF